MRIPFDLGLHASIEACISLKHAIFLFSTSHPFFAHESMRHSLKKVALNTVMGFSSLSLNYLSSYETNYLYNRPNSAKRTMFVGPGKLILAA